MTGASTEELVLAELAGVGDSRRSSAESCALPDLTGALALSPNRLSDRLELATSLDALETDGLIELDAPADAALGGDDVAFSLTDAGRERARAIRERLAAETIEVVDETRTECSLADAADRLEKPLVAVAAETTDDGVYYARDAPRDAFVGREDALRECDTVLERVRNGTGQAVFLVGPAGVGKTTVGERVLERAETAGFDVVRARCHGEGAGAYQPLRDALSDVDADPFEDVGPAVDDVDAYEAQQAALFDDVTGAFATDPTSARPRLLFFDDLHLADDATLAYLEYLLEHLPEYPLAVIGSYRPAELSDDAPVAPNRSPGDGTVTHVELASFDRENTRSLIERVLERRGVPDAFVGAIYEQSDGNPLFVEETVSALLETGQLEPDLDVYPETPAAIDTPDRVRETIDDRVAQFDDSVRDLLQWGSLLGERFAVDVLEAVCELPPEQFRTYLELLVDGALFDRGADGMVQFRSNVVREALPADIPGDERKRRHETIAGVLETHASGDPAADVEERAGVIAFHYERASNYTSALEWYRRAAEHAADIYAQDVAVEHDHSALRLARNLDDQEAILDVAVDLAKIYITTGTYDEAERYVQFARERADDDARRQRLSLLASRIASERGDYGRALEFAEEGLERAGDNSSSTVCDLLGQTCKIEFYRSNYAQAEEFAERQREMAAALGDRRRRADALHFLGAIAFRRASYDEAREYNRQSIALKRELGDRHGVAKSLHSLGLVARKQGRYEDARDDYERALEIFRKVDDSHNAAKTLHNLGTVAIRIGQYDEARSHFEQGLEIYRDIGARHGIAKSLTNRGSVALNEGRHEAARDDFERALEIFRDIDARLGIADCLLNLGNIALTADRFEEARDDYERALEIYRDRELPYKMANSLANLGDVAWERASYADAREYFERAIEIQQDVEAHHDIATSRQKLGRVAAEQGRDQEARDQLRQALETHRDVGDDQNEAECLVSLGRLELENGTTATAREHGEQALEILNDLEATADAIEALELLVECALEEDDAEQGLAWCRRALDALDRLEGTPEQADAKRRQWFERQRDRFEGGLAE